MENLENDNQEIIDILLSELNVFSRKIVISIILIISILITIPLLLISNIMGFISDTMVLVYIIPTLVILILSIRTYNHNRLFYSTHIWLLDCIINKKPLI